MSALALKLIACLCMLLDHIGYFIPGLMPLRIVGRLAFPLYVYLLTEGFRHTSNRLRYGLRLLVFAVLSQPAFGLTFYGNPMYPNGSVMVTLLISFLCLWLLDACRGRILTRILSWIGVLGICCLYYSGLLRSDYGAKGILLALVFYHLLPRPQQESGAFFIGRVRSLWRFLPALLCACCVVYSPTLFSLIRSIGREKMIPISSWTLLQGFSLLAIPLIAFYNGKSGWKPKSATAKKLFQIAFYLYYPAHMLMLCVLLR